MKPVFALLGLVCLGLALSDMFRTVLTLRGAGPLTAFSSRGSGAACGTYTGAGLSVISSVLPGQ